MMRSAFVYTLGVLTAFLFLASVGAMLYLFDRGDVVDLKPATLAALSKIPGWEEVFEAYHTGRKELEIVAEKDRLLAEKDRLLAELQQQMEEKEAAWAEAWEEQERKYQKEMARLQLRQQEPGAAGRESDYELSAQLLAAMKPETAGESLLAMSFETGVAVLSLMDPRKAGKILDTLPPEESARYLDSLGLK